MPRFHAALLAAAAVLAPAGVAQAADPQWRTLIVEMPDGSELEIDYLGDVEPRIRAAMPVVQGAAAVPVDQGAPLSYGGIPRARRFIQPPVAQTAMGQSSLVPVPAIQAAPQPQPPQFVIAGDAPRGSTYEYTLITTGADGRVCSQRTEWTSQGRNREPRVRRTDRGEGCAGLLAPPPVSAPAMPSPALPSMPPLPNAPRIVPVDPSTF